LKGYAGKAVAVEKSGIPNAGNAGRYNYTSNAGVGKSAIPNECNAVWYGYAGKLGTAVKNASHNGGNAV